MWRAFAPSLLLLLTAAQLPLPPEPPARPGSQAAAEAALHRAEASRRAALAAEAGARDRAMEAAARKTQLMAARLAVAARLAAIDQKSEKTAESLAALAAERTRAERALAAKKRAFVPLLPLLERLSLHPAVTLLAVPEPPAQALRAVLVIRGVARRIEAEAAELRRQEAKVAMLSGQIGVKMRELASAEAQQRAAAATLDADVVATAEEEANAEGEAGAAATAAADAAGREKTLKSVIAALIAAAREHAAEEAARERAIAAARAKAAALAAAKREMQKEREKLAFALPTPRVPSGVSPERVVAGVLVSQFGASTPAGPTPGIRYATAPGAHVFAPCSGLVEFAAPFRSYGRLVILDCGQGERVVLAGMSALLVRPGVSVVRGDPLGVMADWDPATPEKRPTLYLELRRGDTPVDPLPWLRAKG